MAFSANNQVSNIMAWSALAKLTLGFAGHIGFEIFSSKVSTFLFVNFHTELQLFLNPSQIFMIRSTNGWEGTHIHCCLYHRFVKLDSVRVMSLKRHFVCHIMVKLICNSLKWSRTLLKQLLVFRFIQPFIESVDGIASSFRFFPLAWSTFLFWRFLRRRWRGRTCG